MKKIVVIIILLAAGSASGYLYYDWYKITNTTTEEQQVDLYSWTDKNGKKHFSNKPPPQDANNINTIKGVRDPGEPIITRIKTQALSYFNKTKNDTAKALDERKKRKEKEKKKKQKKDWSTSKPASSPSEKTYISPIKSGGKKRKS